MKSINTLRNALLIGAASVAFFACSDTNISSPGTTTPVPTPTPTPTPTATPADFDLVPAGTDVSHANLAEVEITTAAGTTINVVEISGTITSDLTLEEGVGYYLAETVFVGNDAGVAGATGTGVTITIPAGATIYADGDAASLVISRGSQIQATGTAAAPIVFTSVPEFERQNGIAAGTADERGEWGGLMINGFAPLNVCDTTGDAVADGGCEKEGEASSGTFGGDDPNDNSGVLRYVRVEHGGIVLNETNEANGIAFQGVGDGTEVDYIHIHNNLDDGVEFFGGTVSLKHLVVSGQSDDAIDWTDGWVGSVQYALVVPGTSLRDDVYGFEGDNQRPNDLLPRSAATLSNLTIIGNDEWVALGRARRGTALNLINSVLTGAPHGIDIDYDEEFSTYDLFDSGDSDFAGVIVDANDGDFIRQDGDIPDGFHDAHVFNDGENIEGASSLVNDYFPGGVEDFLGGVDTTAFGLEAANYVGAFSPTETPANNWAAGWTKAGVLFEEVDATCPTGTTDAGEELDGKTVCDLPLVISTNTRLTDGDQLIYRLTGATFIGTDSGPDETPVQGSIQAELAIDPGVTVYAEAGAEAYLVATRGSQLVAAGTAAAPIRFTAEEAITGDIRDGETIQHTRGYWGGLMLNGRAPINVCDTSGDAVADGGCEKEGEFASGTFGGNVSDDNSGALRYVRVEYAGVIVNDSNEANGIAAQGVGSGTVIDYVQIHNNLDDGIEFFGGTADAKHIVVTGQSDDGIDWTDGWVGRIQYAIVEAGENLRDDAYGFEGDNQRPNDLLPRSAIAMSNFTIIGNSEWVAAGRIRRGSAAHLANGVLVGAPHGIDIDFDDAGTNGSTYDLFASGDSSFNSLLSDNIDGSIVRDDGDIPAGFLTTYAGAANNVVSATNTLGGFSFFGNGTGVVPGTAEEGVTAFDVAAQDDWFDDAQYLGAVADADDKWYLGWTIDANGDVTSAD